VNDVIIPQFKDFFVERQGDGEPSGERVQSSAISYPLGFQLGVRG
jgi:hypothetical protein